MAVAQVAQHGRDRAAAARTVPDALRPRSRAPGAGNQARLRALSRITPRVQAKLEIGAADHPLEREADEVAARVMRMPEPALEVTGAPKAIRRACAACEAEDRKVARKTDGAAALNGAPAPAIVHAALARFGAPLAPSAREFFEPRFGLDLGDVRVHTGAVATQSARAIGARAYTFGADIVFADGLYDLGSDSGRTLIAHELAHVAQQSGTAPARPARTRPASSGPVLRRSTDYDIRNLPGGASSNPSTIFFELGSAAIPATERPKIAPLAAPPTQALTMFGYRSEDEPTGLATTRIGSVSSALSTAGHHGARTPSPEPAAGEGSSDYRGKRAVAVVPTPAGGAPPVSPVSACAATPANPTPEVAACSGKFAAAHPVAAGMLSTAIGEVSGPTAAATAQLGTLFPGTSQATVLAGLTGLNAQVGVMTANHQCHNTCDTRCVTRPAFNTGSGPAAMMTLCPGFESGTNTQENALLLLHEGLHATVGLTTTDFAYRRSRFIDMVPGTQSATNTDSYVLLIMRLGGAAPGSGPPTDTTPGLTAADSHAAHTALTYAEQWLLNAEWDTSQLYESIKANVGHAGGWPAASDYHAGAQHAIGWIFGLSDPGPVSPYTNPPTHDDQIKLAGIHDRYQRMMFAVWTKPITVNAAPAGGTDAWAGNLGPSVTVTPAFLALSAFDQVARLIELMAGSLPTSDVPVARRRNYADAAAQLWWHAGRSGP